MRMYENSKQKRYYKQWNSSIYVINKGGRGADMNKNVLKVFLCVLLSVMFLTGCRRSEGQDPSSMVEKDLQKNDNSFA